MVVRARRRMAAACMAALAAAPAAAQAAQCFPSDLNQPALSPATRRTVVVTAAEDPIVFQPSGVGNDLSLASTLTAILASMRKDVSRTQEQLLATMLSSLKETTFVNPDGGLVVTTAARPDEAGLSPSDMLLGTGRDSFRPVAVFNRFDLHASDWSTCGEYRIVYAMGDGAVALDRMTLIFEAVVRNPSKQEALCSPIVRFWDRLQQPSMTGEPLRKALHGFFFKGDLDGDGTSDLPYKGAVIQADNLGLGVGQVRGNLFVNRTPGRPLEWQLREWHVALETDGAFKFEPAPVGENPFAPLWASDSPGDEPGLMARRRTFQAQAAGPVAQALTAFERGPTPRERTANLLLAELGAGFPRSANTFVSVSHDDREKVSRLVPLASPLRAALQSTIDNMPSVKDCGTTVDHLLARANAMTCAGCHQTSIRDEVAPGVTWPEVAGGFVHVDEKGALSPALERHFLPQRRLIMSDALAKPVPFSTPGAQVSAPTSLGLDLIRALPRDQAAAAVVLLQDAGKTERTRSEVATGSSGSGRRVH